MRIDGVVSMTKKFLFIISENENEKENDNARYHQENRIGNPFISISEIYLLKCSIKRYKDKFSHDRIKNHENAI